MSYYGAHLSIKNGIVSAIEQINEMNGNMIQIFVSNPMSVKISDKKFTQKEYDSIKNKLKETDSKIVIHLPYVINLAKPLDIDPKTSWWIKMILYQLTVSESMNSLGCVVHVGKHLNLTPTEGLSNMYDAFVNIIEYMKERSMETKIILETAAGQGTELITTKNNSLDEFAEFYNRFTDKQKHYLKICVDTCHIFAAGYDISNIKQVRNFFRDFDRLIGINNIVLIHLNDSKCGCGSCVDRHENLGEGKIGLKGLKHFIRYGIYYKIPIILETPDAYEKELEIINKIKEDINKL
jgi:deoxyribonuclease-4